MEKHVSHEGVNGKTLLDGVKTILEKSEYEFQIKYGQYRMNDYINFSQHTNSEENIAHTFNEGFDAAFNIVNDWYTQADKAIDQDIPFTAANNPFITLLAKYAKKVAKEDV